MTLASPLEIGQQALGEDFVTFSKALEDTPIEDGRIPFAEILLTSMSTLLEFR